MAGVQTGLGPVQRRAAPPCLRSWPVPPMMFLAAVEEGKIVKNREQCCGRVTACRRRRECRRRVLPSRSRRAGCSCEVDPCTGTSGFQPWSQPSRVVARSSADGSPDRARARRRLLASSRRGPPSLTHPDCQAVAGRIRRRTRRLRPLSCTPPRLRGSRWVRFSRSANQLDGVVLVGLSEALGLGEVVAGDGEVDLSEVPVVEFVQFVDQTHGGLPVIALGVHFRVLVGSFQPNERVISVPPDPARSGGPGEVLTRISRSAGSPGSGHRGWGRATAA